MARGKKPRASAEFLLFDVVYEDGSRRSNRRIQASDLDGIDDDARVRELLEEQDAKIAEKSGQARVGIKTVTRSPRR